VGELGSITGSSSRLAVTHKLVQRIVSDARNNVSRDRNSVALYKTN
jgi:hypothetical protein